MKYKKIIGGNQKKAEKKFPWLKKADFEDAIIDITRDFLIWKDGIWEDGYWKDGTWEKGKMWNNILQKYQFVKYNKEKKIFEVVEEK